jgi:hypothetical protein
MAQSLQVPQGDEVQEAIRRTALDYIEAWYDGDTAKMERVLHPHLSKRIVIPNGRQWGKGGRLDEMGALTLIQNTRHPPVPKSERRTDVIILDRFEETASVRVDARDWIDYMDLAKWNDEWKVISFLCALRPEADWKR